MTFYWGCPVKECHKVNPSKIGSKLFYSKPPVEKGECGHPYSKDAKRIHNAAFSKFYTHADYEALLTKDEEIVGRVLTIIEWDSPIPSTPQDSEETDEHTPADDEISPTPQPPASL